MKLLDDSSGLSAPAEAKTDMPVGRSAPEQQFERWQRHPGPHTLTPLMKSLEPTLERALKTYGYQDNPNVRSSAKLHMIDVLPRYDVSKAKITTFMTNELRRVQRIGAQQNRIVKVPESAVLDYRNLTRQEERLRDQLGREPTMDELADAARISPDRIMQVRRGARPAITEEYIDQLGGESTSAPAVGGKRMGEEDLWLDSYYHSLTDPSDKKIFEWSMGWKGQPILSKTEMASRLNMSVSAVSQRANRLADKVEQAFEVGRRLL